MSTYLPKLYTRADWGAAAPRSAFNNVLITAREGVMAHYALTEEPPTNKVAETLRGIQRFHQYTRGWKDIAYNHVIDPDGAIWEGRGWLPAGGHCTSMNTPFLGVCYLGDDDHGIDDLTPAAQNSFAWYYREACRQAGKTLKALGHRDGPFDKTDCPGDEIYAKVVKTNFGWATELNQPPVLPKPKPIIKPVPGPKYKFPLPAGYYFGMNDNTKYSVSGNFGRAFSGHPDNWWIREFFTQLERRGWNVRGKWLKVNDGRIGGDEISLIRAFQKDQHLTIDDEIGPMTWNAAFFKPIT